ncbi:MAG: thioesterase family protein [Acidaminococcales bacterium]|jgi:predicted thioesterase|nr:thioesterase family protein [Acidaminococcales bacterium]
MADFDLPVGAKARKSEQVTPANTARAYGSGAIDVYATPAMIGLMEGASLGAVDPLLPDGFGTVGLKVNISHIAAALPGAEVAAEAELTAVNGKKLFFKVAAFAGEKKIGEGTHERYIVNLAEFLARTSQK